MQTPNKLQSSITKSLYLLDIKKFDFWNLFGYCLLEFGYF